jgi:3-oxosteroid 1-dehydrogenase
MASDYDYAFDVVVVGSGGGMCGALTAAMNGLQPLIIEKESVVGGSTAMSGGVIWLPNNPLMQAEGVPDSFEEGMAYFDSVVGDAGPASSEARRATYITEGANMVRLLQSVGLRFVRCEGYSDYYAGMRGIRGASSRGRSFEGVVFDGNQLGPWLGKLRPGLAQSVGIPVMTGEASKLFLVKRAPGSMALAARVGARTARGRLKGETPLTNGASLIAQILKVALEKEVSIWTGTPLRDLIVEEGRVVGVVAERNGRTARIQATHGVLLSAGGFARNPEMRHRYSRQPNPATWTSANPGDTGEAIEMAMKLGAAVDYMDEAWWIPSSVLPNGQPSMHIGDRSRPGSIIVDRSGRRYFNEAISYMEAGREMYAHNSDGSAIPSWLVVDQDHISRYLFNLQARPPKEWFSSGYMKKGDSLEELAQRCGIDPTGLKETVDRFNDFARNGTDPDFHRGEGAHELYQGDYTHKPNASLGPLEKPPFYAIEIYPGDVGTSGGVLCDEFGRVLNRDSAPIPGLYATGNCTASVMGRTYPGAGASIGASLVFAYVAMKHAALAAS